MRKLAIILPVAMVAVYVTHEVASDSGKEARAIPAPTVTAVEVPVAPVPPVTPMVHVEPVAVSTSAVVVAPVLAEQAAQLASVTITLPELSQFDSEFFDELRVSAAAKADLAANFSGFLQVLEQFDEEMSQEEVMTMTGSVLAELAASLEGYVKIETKDGNVVVVADTGRRR
jgi:hypothetical protein